MLSSRKYFTNAIAPASDFTFAAAGIPVALGLDDDLVGIGVGELGGGVVTNGLDVEGPGSGSDVQPATNPAAASSATEHTAYTDRLPNKTPPFVASPLP